MEMTLTSSSLAFTSKLVLLVITFLQFRCRCIINEEHHDKTIRYHVCFPPCDFCSVRIAAWLCFLTLHAVTSCQTKREFSLGFIKDFYLPIWWLAFSHSPASNYCACVFTSWNVLL